MVVVIVVVVVVAVVVVAVVVVDVDRTNSLSLSMSFWRSSFACSTAAILHGAGAATPRHATRATPRSTMNHDD